MAPQHKIQEMYCSKRIGILIITALTYLRFFFLVRIKTGEMDSEECLGFVFVWSCVWVFVIWYFASVVGRWWMRPLETVYSFLCIYYNSGHRIVVVVIFSHLVKGQAQVKSYLTLCIPWCIFDKKKTRFKRLKDTSFHQICF